MNTSVLNTICVQLARDSVHVHVLVTKCLLKIDWFSFGWSCLKAEIDYFHWQCFKVQLCYKQFHVKLSISYV